MSVKAFAFYEATAVPRAVVLAHSALTSQSVRYVAEHCSEELVLIRLLTGTLNVIFLPDGSQVPAKTDLSIMGGASVASPTQTHLRKALARQSITVKELDRYLKRSLGQRAFYRELLAEVCHALLAKSRGLHTVEFLHLYRFLEHISLAFPMLYSSRTSDFKGSFAILKSFFGSEKTGELRFLERFIDVCVDSAVRNQAVTISVTTVDAPYVGQVFGAVRRILVEGNNNPLISETANTELSFPAHCLTRVAVSLRNRVFHYANERPDNISLNEVGHLDGLFLCVNEQLLNWLSVLYFQVLTQRVQS